MARPAVAATIALLLHASVAGAQQQQQAPAQGYAELRGVLRIKWGRTELSTPWEVMR
jgi:hypothetical protein